jgi:hypothetical protein
VRREGPRYQVTARTVRTRIVRNVNHFAVKSLLFLYTTIVSYILRWRLKLELRCSLTSSKHQNPISVVKTERSEQRKQASIRQI